MTHTHKQNNIRDKGGTDDRTLKRQGGGADWVLVFQ